MEGGGGRGGGGEGGEGGGRGGGEDGLVHTIYECADFSWHFIFFHKLFSIYYIFIKEGKPPA